MGKRRNSNEDSVISDGAVTVQPSRALVFVSHDTRDAQLAEAFSTLLSNVTCGMLKSFRTSDKSGKQGLEYGSEWYPEIMKNLEQASDVVCLLTQNSLGRPWILYEAGVAKGKLGTPVHGLALGVPLSQAATGPFAQFQNCDDDVESISKLVMQLARRLPNADPQKNIVDSQVTSFKAKIEQLPKPAANAAAGAPKAKSEDSSAAKMFEEVKVMFRELPDLMELRVRGAIGQDSRKRRQFYVPPHFFDHLVMQMGVPPETVWLLMLGEIRDEAPWLYELGLRVYRALESGKVVSARRAIHDFRGTVDAVLHSPLGDDLRNSKTINHFIHSHVMNILTENLVQSLVRKSKRSTRETEA